MSPWHPLGGNHPLPPSTRHLPPGKRLRVCRASKERGGGTPTSAVRCIRGRDRDNGLPQPPAGRGVGGRGRVPRPAPGVAAPALLWEGAAAGGGTGLCHSRGRRCASPGGVAGVSLLTGKILPLRLQPRQGGCPLPTASSLPAVGERCASGGERWRESGGREIPRPEEIPRPGRCLGPGRAAGGPPRKVVPGRASPVRRGWGTRVLSQHAADTHGLRFGYFSGGGRLG